MGAPAYQERVAIGDAVLYLGDCRDVLASLPRESVDMVWTDPTYGHGNQDGDLQASRVGVRGARKRPAEALVNDRPGEAQEVLDAALVEMARVLRPDCALCCCCAGGGPSTTFAWTAQRLDSEGLAFFHAVVWDKSARGNGLGWRYRRNYEFVMVAHRRNGRLLWSDEAAAVPSVLRVPPVPNDFHPTTKPVALVGEFVRVHTREGQAVLDPFMGSGTTGVACANMGRAFIGIELDPKHFATACKRLADAYARPPLFPPKAAPKPTQAGLFA